jgi:nucleoside-diphosphate-sugar epimerase
MVFFRSGVLVSGSSGFLGSHVCSALEKDSPPEFASVDVRDVSAMAALAARWRPDVILHFASKGTVLTPLGGLPEMLDVAVDGLLHLLRVFRPKKIILSSSCAVYGDTRMLAALPSTPLNPISVYALSKVISERILQQWAEETRNSAVVLRLGNLVGRGSRGLIAYLTNHALRYPDGDPPAQMRGAGHMVRDYVPIDYAVRIVQRAISEEWTPGEAHVLNVGSGIPRTNEQVAAIVQQTLSEAGIALKVHYHDQSGAGEAFTIVLDMQETVRRSGIDPPSGAEVTQAVREAVHFCMDQTQATKSASA